MCKNMLVGKSYSFGIIVIRNSFSILKKCSVHIDLWSKGNNKLPYNSKS